MQWAGAAPALPAAGTIEVGWMPAARSALQPEQQQAVEAAAARALAAVLAEAEARGYGDHMAVSADASCYTPSNGADSVLQRWLRQAGRYCVFRGKPLRQPCMAHLLCACPAA